MGDTRYQEPYARIRDARDRSRELARMTEEDVIGATAAVARKEDCYLANILATEAINRWQRTAAMISATAEGMLAIDVDARITFMNRAAERLLGVPRGEPVGLDPRRVLRVLREDGQIAPFHEHPVVAALRGNDACGDDEARWFVRLDGTTFPASCLAAPILMNKELRGAVMVFRDATESHAAREALRESAAKLRAIVTGAPIIVFAIDRNGRFTLVEGRGLQDIHEDPARLIGRSVVEFAGYGHDLRRAALRALAGEEVDAVVAVDGCTLQTRWVPTTEADGSIDGALGVAMDISQLKQAQERAEGGMSLLEATLEATLDGILVVDRHGKIARYNRKFQDMWRLPESALASGDDGAALNIACAQVLDPEGFLARVRELYAHPERESEDLVTLRDGRVFERYSRPQRAGGEIVGRVWSFREVTASRRTKALLEESEQRYRALFDYNPSGVGTADLDGRILTANPAMLRIVGRRLEEVVGKEFKELVAPDDVAKARDVLESVLRGAPKTTRIDLVRKDGRRVRVDAGAIPIIVDEKLVGVHGVVTPVGEKPD